MFKREHKHKIDYDRSRTKIVPSIMTGIPVQVSHQHFCKCGVEMSRSLTGAGYQQLYWGAKEEDLFWPDYNPPHPWPAGMTEETKEEIRAGLRKNGFPV